MGQSISASRNALTAGNTAEREKELQDLEILQKVVDSVLDSYEVEQNASAKGT